MQSQFVKSVIRHRSYRFRHKAAALCRLVDAIAQMTGLEYAIHDVAERKGTDHLVRLLFPEHPQLIKFPFSELREFLGQ
ncbi:hypothetical protein D3C73_1561980 [compost metagenome]